MPWLLRAEAYDIAGASVVTRYFSTVAVTTDGGDTPAHTYWVRRIRLPPTFTRSIAAGERLGGRSEAGFGTVSLANQDGALDELADLVFDGHEVELLFADGAAPAFADFATVFLGVSRHVVVGDEVVFTLAERRDLTDLPYHANRFAGTGDAEGGTDWTDVIKPRALGVCWQIEPRLIDEANLVYCYGDGVMGGVMQARDRGVPLKRGGNFASYAAMLAASIGSADFITCDAVGMIRLKNLPAGPLTMDVLGRRAETDLVVNGTFPTDLASWSAGTGWVHGATGGGRAERTAVGSISSLSQAITTEAGAWYALGITAVETSSGETLSLIANGVSLVTHLSTDIRRVAVFQAASTSSTIGVAASADWAGWVDDVTCFRIYARAGEMLERILLDDTALTSGDITAADITALHADTDAALGHWFAGGAEQRQIPDILDLIAGTVGAWWGFDPATGKFVARRIEAPASTADHEIAERDVRRIIPREPETRLRQQVIEAARRWRPLQESEVAGAVTDATRRSLTAASYPVTATHAATETEARTWRDERFVSLFAYEDDAQAEADRRVALFGPKRLAFEVEVARIEGVELGQTVQVTHSRYGLAAGRKMIVLRVIEQGETDSMVLTLWG